MQGNKIKISEVIKNKDFIYFVRENVNDILITRNLRPLYPKEGYRYKRGWYERIDEQGNMNEEYFLENIEAIWQKKSTLNAEIRSVIKFVCDRSLHQMLLKNQKENEK